MKFLDGLTNLITGLGTGKDKGTATEFAFPFLDRGQIENMYRGDWIARKLIDLIAFDMCREWRTWQAKETQIEKIEAEEERLGLQHKVMSSIALGRLYGGAAIYIGTPDLNPALELNIEAIQQGGVTYLHVFTQHQIKAEELIQDPMSPFFGEPLFYQISAGANAPGGLRDVRIHPSRIVRFMGSPYPARDALSAYDPLGWSDSVLQIVYNAVRDAAAAPQHIASLLPELKTDVIMVPGLSNALSTVEGTKRVQGRFGSASLIKSMHNILLLEGSTTKDGAGETWDQRQINFATFPELIRTFLQIAAGAADIPVTRLLGQSPSGLNATGDADIRNYYDHIAAKQKVELRPKLKRLDDCLIRSALGRRPDSIYFEFSPLWQMSEQEKAEVAIAKAETTQIYVTSGLIDRAILAKAARNQLVEDGQYPGIEDAFEQFDKGKLEISLPPDPIEQEARIKAEFALKPVAAARSNVMPIRRKVGDATPRTLYVRRNVLNGADIFRWARGEGFETTLAKTDLHVTIAFSRAPVDWMSIGEAWASELTVSAGGPRIMERFGDATVLLFKASELEWRHSSIKAAGASWDHPEYQPHITISYADRRDLSEITPYQGQILLGPEIFEEVDLNWVPEED